MNAPAGFQNRGVDALFLRNSQQYWIVAMPIVLTYVMLRAFSKFLRKTTESS